MKNLVGCALMPHPPIMIPEVGKSELEKIKKTTDAVSLVSQIFKQNNPETVVIITPHGTSSKDAVTISVHPRLRGSFSSFGAPEVTLGFETDGQLIKLIVRHSSRLGINLIEMTEAIAKNHRLSLELDHGALVPLYYLNKAGFKGQIVHLCGGMLSYEEMYTFGKAVQIAIETTDKKVAVIASGDLSHRLIPEAPAGFHRLGAEFDAKLMEAMKNIDVKSLFNMEKELVECAGECGLRPAFFLMGVMGGLEAEVGVVSYEGPFGVGYGVVSYTINGKKQCPKSTGKNDTSKCSAENTTKEETQNKKDPTGREQIESNPAALAKASLKYYLENGRKMPAPEKILPPLVGQAGVFVSLKKNGDLRGCIGTFLPQEPTVAQEIINNAISAGMHDPRFLPVDLKELPDLEVSVDILSTPEQVNSLDALDTKKYGVIVRHKNKSGLLLPDLEGIDAVSEQVSIAMRKAGISSSEEIDLYRFTVTRYT